MTSFVVVNAAFLTRLSSNSSLASNDSVSFELVDCFAFDVDEDGTDDFCKWLPMNIVIKIKY